MPEPEDKPDDDDPLTPEEEAELIRRSEVAMNEPGVWLVLDDARDIEHLF